MLEKILKLYTAAMAGDVRSPTPHLFGPPGCGKSTAVEQAAQLLEVNLHTINVSRLSPLEIEGVQMPVDMDTDKRRLHQLPATFWANLREGDILLLDEFLRGFPEVYNGLLDILTSRKVGSFTLPKVFIIAASNSIVTYDKALEDRLLHLPVDDPRGHSTTQKAARQKLVHDLVKHIGLLPTMVDSGEVEEVVQTEVLPMYAVLDQLSRRATTVGETTADGHSVRNLIGQALLREVHSPTLRELLMVNNIRAINQNKHQYVVLLNGKNPDQKYLRAALDLSGNEKLTPRQQSNLEVNLQLISMEKASKEQGDREDDSVFV